MTSNKYILPFVLSFINTNLFAQTSWQQIKDSATFIVADTSYTKPYIQPINVGGWEDGLHITRDGLNLYAFYTPVDMISFSSDVVAGDSCFIPVIAPYYRGPQIGVDTTTPFTPCGRWMHSDIIRATRNSISVPFNAWDSTLVSSDIKYDGAPQIVQNPATGQVEFFLFVRNNGDSLKEDIMWMRNVSLNPVDTAERMPLSTDDVEDNPHLERINGDTLVLFYDQDSKEGFTSDMLYSVSYNNGTTWSVVDTLSTLSVPGIDEVQPHLWKDPVSGVWWLYYSTVNPNNNRQSIFKSKKKSSDNTKWDDWDTLQLVITPGIVKGSTDLIPAIGEPSLTQWGDLSFVVVYERNPASDSTNVYDADPWFLPKKGSPLSGQVNIDLASLRISLFPNPSANNITIEIKGSNEEHYLMELFDITGKKERSRILPNGKNFVEKENLVPGMYFLTISQNGILLNKSKIVFQ